MIDRKTLESVVGYIAAGFHGEWPKERTAVWIDQLVSTGYSAEVLQGAARAFVATSRFPVISEFLEIAKARAIDAAQRAAADPSVLRLAPDETPADPQKVQAIFRRFRAQRRAKRTDDEAAAERERQRANNERFRREARGDAP